MPLKPRFCAQCGAPVTTRSLQGRQRVVCSACATVFYENPLPVAATVLLNERREVLLVKRRRDPHRGQWCLPMGFAELGETIADAARRELQEETGVVGHIVQLLTADSMASDFYGDLLIVTFELTKVGGAEQAGDDAEEVGYFPISRHPPLAFAANEKAVLACCSAHQEAWAIQDSFAKLRSSESQPLLSDELAALIQEHCEELAGLWLADVRSNPTTPSYHRGDAAELLARGTQAVAELSRWLTGQTPNAKLKAFYRDVAGERKADEFALHEVLSAVALLKKQVWNFAAAHVSGGRPIDAYRLLELSRRIAVFFDLAMYQVARGYESEA